MFRIYRTRRQRSIMHAQGRVALTLRPWMPMVRSPPLIRAVGVWGAARAARSCVADAWQDLKALGLARPGSHVPHRRSSFALPTRRMPLGRYQDILRAQANCF